VFIKWLPSENTALIPDCFRDQTKMDLLMDSLSFVVKEKVNSIRQLKHLESMTFIAHKLRDQYMSCTTGVPVVVSEGEDLLVSNNPNVIAESVVLPSPITAQKGKQKAEELSKKYGTQMQKTYSNTTTNGGNEDGFVMFYNSSTGKYSPEQGINPTPKSIDLVYSHSSGKTAGKPIFDIHSHPSGKDTAFGTKDLFDFVTYALLELDRNDLSRRRKEAANGTARTCVEEYVSFLETKRYRYALVILDIRKAKIYFGNSYLQAKAKTTPLDKKWAKATMQYYATVLKSIQKSTVAGVKAYLGSNHISGIGFYSSSNKRTFVLEN